MLHTLWQENFISKDDYGLISDCLDETQTARGSVLGIDSNFIMNPLKHFVANNVQGLAHVQILAHVSYIDPYYIVSYTDPYYIVSFINPNIYRIFSLYILIFLKKI